MTRPVNMLVVVSVLALLAAVGAFVSVVPVETDRRSNRLIPRPRPAISEAARRLHGRLLVADLHADTLLWDRDPLQRSRRGHVDVPRLLEGNVALQAFTVVTKTPRRLNIESNDDRSDDVTLLAMAQRWPPATWRSLKERALHQARRLDDAAARSGGRLTVIRSRSDLAAYVARRGGGPRITAGILGLEGAHALEGDLANVDVLFGAGFRMVGLVHFFDNEFGGSAHGVAKGGLTAKGRDLVRRLEERRMLVDLAHASPRTIDETLAIATRPVVVSHTGVKGTCDNVRNLSDDELRGVARTGGVIGIGFWGRRGEGAVCGEDAGAVARAIRYAVDVAGVDHVGLGSDWDGTVSVPFDAAGLVELTDALLAAGFSDEDVTKVMGGNAVRLLSTALP